MTETPNLRMNNKYYQLRKLHVVSWIRTYGRLNCETEIQNEAFWAVAPSSVVVGYQRF